MSALAPVSSRVVEALRQSSHPALRALAVEETRYHHAMVQAAPVHEVINPLPIRGPVHALPLRHEEGQGFDILVVNRAATDQDRFAAARDQRGRACPADEHVSAIDQ